MLKEGSYKYLKKMDTSDLKIINAKIVTPTRIIKNGTLLAQHGKITAIAEGNIDYESKTVIDAGGKFLSPGFVDIHVHGGGGYDFMDNTVDAYLEIAKLHASYGTTAFTPTTLSCERNALLKTLSLYEEAAPLNVNGAQFLGMHIEGPYFSMEQRGSQ